MGDVAAGSRLTAVLEQAIAAAEPAYAGAVCLSAGAAVQQLLPPAPCAEETDAARKTLLLATAAVAREMTRALGWLGIEAPPVM